VSNRYAHVERKAGHTVHDTVADTYAPFMTSDDADAAASLLNIFGGQALGFVWLTADKVDEYEAGLPDPETVNPDDTGSDNGDVD
jgi:hypothetical protein